MRCEEIDCQIHGNDLQVVEVELDPGETVIAEAGAMNWMGDRIAFETKMGDGSAADAGIMGKLLSAGKRALTGKSLFMTHFRNEGRGQAASSLRRTLPRPHHPRRHGRNGRRAALAERRLSLRRPRHRALHRF